MCTASDIQNAKHFLNNEWFQDFAVIFRQNAEDPRFITAIAGKLAAILVTMHNAGRSADLGDLLGIIGDHSPTHLALETHGYKVA